MGHRQGGEPGSGRKSPGRSKFEPVTLERVVAHDTEFDKWANKVWNFESDRGERCRYPASARIESVLLATPEPLAG